MTFDTWYFRDKKYTEADKELMRQTIRYTTMQEAWEEGYMAGATNQIICDANEYRDGNGPLGRWPL